MWTGRRVTSPFSECMINLAFFMHFLLITLCLSLVTLQWAELSFSYENNNAELQIYSLSTLIYRKPTHQMTIGEFFPQKRNSFLFIFTFSIAEFFPRNRNITRLLQFWHILALWGLLVNFLQIDFYTVYHMAFVNTAQLFQMFLKIPVSNPSVSQPSLSHLLVLPLKSSNLFLI